MKIHPFRTYIGLLIAVGVFSFLGRKLFLSWRELSGLSWNFHIWQLLASFATLLLYRALLVQPWIASLKQFNAQLPYSTGFQIFNLSQLGRYLPGKVWLVVGQVYLCKNAGIGKAQAFVSTLLQLAFLTFSGILIAVFVFVFTPADLPFAITLPNLPIVTGCVVFAGLSILAVCRRLIFRLICETVFKLNPNTPFSSFRLLHSFLIYLLLWCVYGLAFFLLIKSLFPLEWHLLPAIVASYALAWTAGFLSFVTPGGLGVREGALSLLLAPYLPPATAMLVALLSRVWSIAADLVLASIALGIRYRNPAT